MDTLKFDLVTPEATFFSGAASMVEAPGTEGDFGVLPGHMDFISTLRPGIIKIHNDKEEPVKIFVVSGIAEANAVSCTILAEQVVNLNTVTLSDAETRLANAKDMADKAFEEVAKIESLKEVALSEALVAALSA